MLSGRRISVCDRLWRVREGHDQKRPEGTRAGHRQSWKASLDHDGSQFYANESGKKKGVSRFEERLVRLDIRQILARVCHPQTNGKLERLHGEIQRKLCHFEDSSYDKTVLDRGTKSGHVGNPFNTAPRKDAIDRFMEWYNCERDHMSLDWENQETPAQAFMRKMAPKGETIIDQHTGEEYRAA